MEAWKTHFLEVPEYTHVSRSKFYRGSDSDKCPKERSVPDVSDSVCILVTIWSKKLFFELFYYSTAPLKLIILISLLIVPTVSHRKRVTAT